MEYYSWAFEVIVAFHLAGAFRLPIDLSGHLNITSGLVPEPNPSNADHMA